MRREPLKSNLRLAVWKTKDSWGAAVPWDEHPSPAPCFKMVSLDPTVQTTRLSPPGLFAWAQRNHRFSGCASSCCGKRAVQALRAECAAPAHPGAAFLSSSKQHVVSGLSLAVDFTSPAIPFALEAMQNCKVSFWVLGRSLSNLQEPVSPFLDLLGAEWKWHPRGTKSQQC